MRRFGRILLPLLLAGSLCLRTPAPYAQSLSSDPDSTSVVLSREEADSLIATLDYYDEQVRLLQIDLDECRAMTRLDSLQIQGLIDASHESWYIRSVKHPVFWFSLGVLLTYATRG